MSVTEAAEKYFVCDRTIRNWIRTGKLNAELIVDMEAKKKGRFAKRWLVKKQKPVASEARGRETA